MQGVYRKTAWFALGVCMLAMVMWLGFGSAGSAYAQGEGDLAVGTSSTLMAQTDGGEAEEGSVVEDDTPGRYVPVYRLFDLYGGTHVYTTSAAERNSLAPRGWSYEGTPWFVPEMGDPIYRVYNPNSGLHHLTTSAYERDYLVQVGWLDEGIAFNTCDEDDGGAIPIYRLYNPGSGEHFFTTSADERDALIKTGWIDEGVSFYEHEADESFVDDMGIGSNDINTWPADGGVPFDVVYRLYNPGDGDHFYTLAKAERNSAAASLWHYEGAVWQAANAGIPIYRLQNPNSGEHFLTTNALESGALEHAGWRYEGISFYSSPEADNQRIPVYRVYNPGSGFHHLTTNEGERDSLVGLGWRNEGVAFYVRPLDPDFQDDMDVWKPTISGDAELDTQLEIILFFHRDLRSAYDYVVGFPYKSGERFWGGPHILPESTTIPFAKEMIANGGGNCYRFASLFCWLARGLGYSANVVSGWVPSASGGQAPHGWVEVYIDGQTYICDPDLQHEIGGDWYMRSYSNPPTSYGSW